MWTIELTTYRFERFSACLIWVALLGCGQEALAQSVQTTGLQNLNGGARIPARAPLQTATLDPFSPFAAPPPSLQKQKKVVTAVVTPIPVAVPMAQPIAPPVELIFLGRVGSGQEVQVFALHQGRTVLLQAGEALPNGYVVQSVSKREVQLRYTSLDQITNWPLPVAPLFETR
jgi:hypothetical protein